MNTNRTRGVGLIRLSKTPDPASTSVERQREHIEAFADQHDIRIVGWAIDTATSAFHIPPERRRQVKEWLDRPGDYDCMVYWRQDRLVRRAADFMGLVTWCKANAKALYSATEGTGDVTEHTGVLIGFIKAWQAEGESQNTSDRVKDAQAKLAKMGRWRGGRVPFGARPVCVCHDRANCPSKKAEGWKLVADTGSAKYGHCRDSVKRVTAGQSVNSVIADLNRRGIYATDGKPWHASTMWQLLRNRVLLDLGIVDASEWNDLQTALKSRANKRTVRTATASPLLDLVFCGRCGGKVYHWRRGENGQYQGRCRNEMHRYEAGKACDLPMIRYELLQEAVATTVADHAAEVIEERVTDHARKLRVDDIATELMDLLPEFAAKQIDRDEFVRRQTELMDEQEKLEKATGEAGWRPAGETVGQRWARLDETGRRLWLLSTGKRWTVDRETRADGAKRWRIESNWESATDKAGVRERFTRPA